MIKRLHVIVLAGLCFLFAAITAWKHWPDSNSNGSKEPIEQPAARDSIRQFWETYRRATELRTSGDLKAAANAYRRALALDSTHQDGLYYLGNIYRRLGQPGAAERQWRKLLRVNPRSARAYVQLGELHFCSTPDSAIDIQAAEEAYRRALELHNEETRPLLRLGEIALIHGELSEARERVDAVVGSNYRNADAYFLKGYLRWKAGASREATVHYARAARYAEAAAVTASEHMSDGVPAVTLEARDECRTFPLPSLRRSHASSSTATYRTFANTLTSIRERFNR